MTGTPPGVVDHRGANLPAAKRLFWSQLNIAAHVLILIHFDSSLIHDVANQVFARCLLVSAYGFLAISTSFQSFQVIASEHRALKRREKLSRVSPRCVLAQTFGRIGCC
jgi:hypothetical protein